MSPSNSAVKFSEVENQGFHSLCSPLQILLILGIRWEVRIKLSDSKSCALEKDFVGVVVCLAKLIDTSGQFLDELGTSRWIDILGEFVEYEVHLCSWGVRFAMGIAKWLHQWAVEIDQPLELKEHEVELVSEEIQSR
jgi:hypothetical protein